MITHIAMLRRFYIAMAATSALVAQVALVQLGKLHLPRDGVHTNRVALGDVNGDGALDLVTSTNLTPGEVRVHLQGPGAVFAMTRSYAATLTAQPVLADLDGDRDLDLLLGGSSYTSPGCC